ncbi:MAG: hypothetical protein Q4D79_06625 [Propionibacteriaceae bacterium]|nr:hypothetical protein [Propionibacteriaceae bacterium]
MRRVLTVMDRAAILVGVAGGVICIGRSLGGSVRGVVGGVAAGVFVMAAATGTARSPLVW